MVSERLNAAWARHADEPDAVYAEAGALLAEATADALGGPANLLFHVGAEHLGRIGPVADALTTALVRVEDPTAAAPLRRLLAACALVAGTPAGAAAHLAATAGDPGTNRIIVLGLAVGALAGQGHAPAAAPLLEEAASLAATNPGGHRSIAISANNLAAALEQRASRTAAEDALMLRAAELARAYWEKAGTWMNVERAEYRLAMARLARGEAALAAGHAREVLRIVAANGDDPGEAFFGWEALARAERAAGDPSAARAARDAAAERVPRIADEGFRAFCVTALAAVDAGLADP